MTFSAPQIFSAVVMKKRFHPGPLLPQEMPRIIAESTRHTKQLVLCAADATPNAPAMIICKRDPIMPLHENNFWKQWKKCNTENRPAALFTTRTQSLESPRFYGERAHPELDDTSWLIRGSFHFCCALHVDINSSTCPLHKAFNRYLGRSSSN